jgi:hypothetical protein
MKVLVNGSTYDIDIISQKIVVNGTDLAAKINEEQEEGKQITVGQETYYLDFIQEGEEGEPSLMIINGMTYLISKS